MLEVWVLSKNAITDVVGEVIDNGEVISVFSSYNAAKKFLDEEYEDRSIRNKTD